MTEVTPIFKDPKPPPRQRGWNSTMPAPTRRIKQRTHKAARDDRTFKQGQHPTTCQRCREAPAVDASHRAPRSQRPDLRGDPTNRDNLCRECHEWVETNPDQAKADGWRDTETYEKANDPMTKVIRQLGEQQ